MALDPKYKSLLRFLLLVLATAAHSVACTPPPSATVVTNECLNNGPQASKADEGKNNMLSSVRAAKWSVFWARGSKYFVWSITVIEGATRLLSLYPTSTAAIEILPILCPNIAPPFHPLTFFPSGTSKPFFTIVSSPTLSFSLGFLSVLAGAQIRKACFDALGSMFIFTRTVLAEHRLITRGPYEVVRHPGYVGMVFVRVGIISLLFSSGSWARTVGAIPWPFGPAFTFADMQAPGGIFVGGLRMGLGLFTFLSAGELSVLLRRASKEDQALRNKFGEKWEKYRKNVPYKFIPLIY